MEKCKKRMALILIVLEIGFGLLVVRLFSIQKLKRDEIYEKNIARYQKRSEIKVKRGKILDRHSNLLAINRDQISVWADPERISAPRKAAKILSPLLNYPQDGIIYKLNQKDRRFVWLKRKLDYGLLDKIKKKLDENKIDGIGFRLEEERSYPNDELACHVIGYTNFDNIGMEGVERSYDDEIASYQIVKPIEQEESKRIPEYNHSIVLTIDEQIQHIAESELTDVCKKQSAKSGSAIVMNPKTGEILAMANYPNYNLNKFDETEEFNKRNRAIWQQYEPGSAFKVFVASAVLDQGLMDPGETEDCEMGEYEIHGKTIHDVHEYGTLSLNEIIARSSNIGMVKVASRLTRPTLSHYVKAFGFGAKTGIDAPYEKKGNIQSIGNKSTLTAFIYVPFGQGISVTSLQMINGLNAIANGGFLMKPYVLKRIIDDQDKVIKENLPKRLRRVVSRETADIMTQMLICTVEYGTGMNAQLEDYRVAGKTGTAQKAGKYGYSGKYISSFMGFLPAYDPQISIIIVIDEPKKAHYASLVAAPAFHKIAKRTMEYLNVQSLVYSKGKQKVYFSDGDM